jgi:hypothetical protein
MGMSLAYCDNDTPGTDRDNFFGSVWVPQPDSNSHWMNADQYGSVRLVNEGFAMNHAVEVTGSIADFEITETGTDLVIHDNLLSVFNDPDEDPLEYTVQNDHSELTFTIDGQVLKVHATESFEGEAEVTVTATDGEFEAQVSFKVNRTVIGMEKTQLAGDPVRCYPNPFTDLVQGEVNLASGYSGPFTVQLVDLAGRQVASLQEGLLSGGFGTFTVEMGDQPMGLYILRLRAGDEVHTQILTRK